MPVFPVIDFPTLATFSTVMTEPRFFAAIGIAALAGLVRGFTGFGSALIYVPLMSAVYGPLIAAPTFVIADTVTGLTFLASTWRKTLWSEVLPMGIAAVTAAQFGTYVLQYANPVTLRWALSLLVFVAVGVLASGWRYHGRPKLIVSIAVGLVAGLLGGAVQISGPPIIVYWFGSGHPADILRANFFGYFSVFSGASVITYALHGLLTATVLVLSCFITPATMAAMAIGTKLFNFAGGKSYRAVGYIVALLSGILAMPVFDRLLH